MASILRLIEVLGIVTILALLVLVLVAGSVDRVKADIGSPLNFALFREPARTYSDSVVNFWVRKPWKANGERIPCYRVDRPASNRVVLYAHGNAANLADCVALCQTLSQELDATVVTFDYSGYGLNAYDAFERSAKGVNDTTKAVYDVLHQEFPNARFVLYGFSLGAGPVLHLAASEPGAQVVIHGAFTSVLDMVKLWVPHEAALKVFAERWNNRETVHKLQQPLMILHGDKDELVPLAHAKTIQSAARHARFVTLPGAGHSDYDVAKVSHAISEFLSDSREASA